MLLFCNNNSRSNITLDQTEPKRRSGIISQSIKFEDSEEDVVSYPKTKQEENLIRDALGKTEFLSKALQGSRIRDFIDCMYSKMVHKGETLIREGEIESHLYISKKGTFGIMVQDHLIHTFNDGRIIGELAILYSTKSQATVKCIEDGSVWVLDCSVFKKLLIKSALNEQEDIVHFLRNVPKLSSASKEKLYQVANLLKTEYFPASSIIIRQGESGDKFYITRAGSVTVFKNNKQVAQLSRGQYFGEVALLKKERYRLTVVADEPGTECFTLSRKEFISRFGGVEEFSSLETQSVYDEKVIDYSDFKLSDFTVINTLGVGGFGRVELVQHNSFKGQIFALKSMQKLEIVARSHQDQVYNEKHLQISCNSKFIVRLYMTFRDPKYVYLLLEPCLGGDLWNLLHRQKKGCFEESAAKFYAGCVLEALAYLHERDIIYRDLKPENVMVHNNGYLKLTDFGFAKKTDSKEKTYTFVGTAEYVAPEIISNKGHNKGVDYWAFGIFIFELLVGRTPFSTNDPGYLKTYKLILSGINRVSFPYFMSSKAKGIIKKLCMPISSDRLGCQRGGIKDIKNHSWFLSLNWNKLRNFEIEPPIKLVLQNNMDTRYFEKFKESTRVPLDDYSAWDNDF